MPIQRPAAYYNPDEFINRKNFSSLNVQVIVNGKEEFTNVVARWPGSVHDSRIFKNSAAKDILQSFSGENAPLILADSGYGIAPYIMTPYPNPRSREQIEFNRLFKKERVIVERVIGQLKKRFPTLGHPVRLKTDRIPEWIIACCVLHNIAKHLGDEMPDDFHEHSEEVEGEGEASPAAVRLAGQTRRNELADLIVSM